MIEVFKTNIETSESAHHILLNLIEAFPGYQINFDLEDCDRILRVKNDQGEIDNNEIIKLINLHGHDAEVLADEIKYLP